MATRIAEAYVEISTRATALAAGLRNAETSVRSAMDRISAFATNRVTTAIGGIVAFESIRRASMFAIREAANQEAAEAGLRGALRATGQEVNANLRRFNEFASELQRTTTVADDTTLSLLRIGTVIGKLTGTELENATRAAIGLSRAIGTDVETAMTLISRAAQGQTQTLARYGITLDENASDAQRFQQVVQFGLRGLALEREAVKTTTGAWAQLTNAFGDAAEVVGGKLTPRIAALAREMNGLLTGRPTFATSGGTGLFGGGIDAFRNYFGAGNDLITTSESDAVANLNRAFMEAERASNQIAVEANKLLLGEREAVAAVAEDVDMARSVAGLRKQQAHYAEVNARLDQRIAMIKREEAEAAEQARAAGQFQEGLFFRAREADIRELTVQGKLEEAEALRRETDSLRFVTEANRQLEEAVKDRTITEQQAADLRKQVDFVAERDQAVRAARDAAAEGVSRGGQFLGSVGEATFGGNATAILDANKQTAEQTRRTADLLQQIRNSPAAAVFN